MYIVSTDKKAVINFEQTTSVYVGADGCTIKADFGNGKGCQFGRYSSERGAQVALEMIASSVGKCEVCFAPDDDTVRARINLEEQRQHPIDGKKRKGHGGS